jgi:hypothetical protein
MLYGIAGVVALFELGVTWLSLHPNVPADYRAYYLDQSTTCLNEPVSGDYMPGMTLRTVSGHESAVKAINVCGWEGPVGNGLHAVGEQSRLRLAVWPGSQNLTLLLEMSAVDMAGRDGQPVDVVANGTTIGSVKVYSGTPQSFTFAVPGGVLNGSDLLDVELRFPEAILISPQDSNTRKRSIKLTAIRLG